MKKNILIKDLYDFKNYFFSFYGEDGIYPIANLTVDEFYNALAARLAHSKIEFHGDTIDRERVRDIILANRG